MHDLQKAYAEKIRLEIQANRMTAPCPKIQELLSKQTETIDRIWSDLPRNTRKGYRRTHDDENNMAQNTQPHFQTFRS